MNVLDVAKPQGTVTVRLSRSCGLISFPCCAIGQSVQQRSHVYESQRPALVCPCAAHGAEHRLIRPAPPPRESDEGLSAPHETGPAHGVSPAEGRHPLSGPELANLCQGRVRNGRRNCKEPWVRRAELELAVDSRHSPAAVGPAEALSRELPHHVENLPATPHQLLDRTLLVDSSRFQRTRLRRRRRRLSGRFIAAARSFAGSLARPENIRRQAGK